MLINDIHNFIGFLKNQGQNIYHTPEEIDDVINRASLDLFRQEEKKYEEQQIITDTLGDFKEIYEPTLDVTGVYSLPTDYVRLTNLGGIISSDDIATPTEDEWEYCNDSLNDAIVTPTAEDIEVEMDLVDDSTWVSRKRDKVAPPTVEYPIARIRQKSLEVLPKTVKPIVYYLRYPRKAEWAYTISNDGRSFIFDEINSTDLDWSEISHNEIIEKVCVFLGVALNETILMQYEQLQKRNNNE